MSILNDVDRDYSEVFDRLPYYTGCAKRYHYTNLTLYSAIKTQLEKGFDSSETWSLDMSIAAFIVPRLEYKIQNTCTYPPSLEYKEWIEILKQIKAAFEIISNSCDWGCYEEESTTVYLGLGLFYNYYLSL